MPSLTVDLTEQLKAEQLRLAYWERRGDLDEAREVRDRIDALLDAKNRQCG